MGASFTICASLSQIAVTTSVSTAAPANLAPSSRAAHRRVPSHHPFFVGVGITKVRLTGGEPLLRRGLLDLIGNLSGLRTLLGEPLDLALTTNGHLLDSLAKPLKAAGLDRVTVSMDAVDEPTFERITRVPGSYTRCWPASARPRRRPHAVKINCVLLRGFNDDQVEGFARFARDEDVIVRFIEFMPLEEGRLWTPRS